MKPLNLNPKLILNLILILSLSSCQKYLEERPDKAQVIPISLSDCAALLDNTGTMNVGAPGAGEIASDNLLILEADWLPITDPTTRGLYIWDRNLFDNDYNDWTWTYQWVLHANVVLETVADLPRTASNGTVWDDIRGRALFFRAYGFYLLAQQFCRPYSAATAATDLGLPLRTTSAISEPSVRATVQQTYEQILGDLEEAARLLQISQRYKTRPGRAAAFALLAKTALVMARYKVGESWADSCLSINSSLLNFNTLNSADPNPVPRFNAEVLLHNTLFDYSVFYPPVGKVDTALYALYGEDDLRRTMFFKENGDGTASFYGSYDGSASLFGGLATDEVYLLRAECRARSGNTSGALEDLNFLMQYRYRTGTFIPFTAAAAQEALNMVLTERHKELLFRGIRWSDLRRLNGDAATAKTLTRVLEGKQYRLLPGDARYVLPIPPRVVNLSGMLQNP